MHHYCCVSKMLVSDFRETWINKTSSSFYQGQKRVPKPATYRTPLNVLLSLGIHLRQIAIQNDLS